MIVKYSTMKTIGVMLLLMITSVCPISTSNLPTKSNKKPIAIVARLPGIIGEFSDFGYDRGKYDAEHSLYDYRDEFIKDPLLAWAYIGYNFNIDGTQDSRSSALVDKGSKLSQDEYSRALAAFITSYKTSFEKFSL